MRPNNVYDMESVAVGLEPSACIFEKWKLPVWLLAKLWNKWRQNIWKTRYHSQETDQQTFHGRIPYPVLVTFYCLIFEKLQSCHHQLLGNANRQSWWWWSDCYQLSIKGVSGVPQHRTEGVRVANAPASKKSRPIYTTIARGIFCSSIFLFPAMSRIRLIWIYGNTILNRVWRLMGLLLFGSRGVHSSFSATAQQNSRLQKAQTTSWFGLLRAVILRDRNQRMHLPLPIPRHGDLLMLRCPTDGVCIVIGPAVCIT